MSNIAEPGWANAMGSYCSGCGTMHLVGQCVPAREPKAEPVATGWRCPCCRTVWAPFKDRCLACEPLAPHFCGGTTA